MRRTAFAILALGLAMPAEAMSVAEFLGKADALYAKGVMALFSPDIGVLKAEGVAATKAWRAQAHAPNACPPTTKVAITQDEFMAMIRTVPPERRAGTSVAQAVIPALNRRYPCG